MVKEKSGGQKSKERRKKGNPVVKAHGFWQRGRRRKQK